MKQIYFLLILSATSLNAQDTRMLFESSISNNRGQIRMVASPLTVYAWFKPTEAQYDFPVIRFTSQAGSGNRVAMFNSAGEFYNLPLSNFQYTDPNSTITFNQSSKTATINQSLVMMADRAADSIAAINSRILTKANSSDVYTKSQSDARFYPLSSNPNGYLTSYTETDPVWNAQKTNYYTKAQSDGLYQPLGSYLTSESDPV